MRDIVQVEFMLRQSSEEVDIDKDGEKVLELFNDMKEILESREDALGISAIQLGENKRMFAIKLGDTVAGYVNPLITKARGLSLSIEGCLSLPGRQYILPRYDEIEVYYQNALGKPFGVKMSGLISKVFQHEYDHLSGILISDLGIEYTDELKELTTEQLLEIFVEAGKKAGLDKKPKKNKRKHKGKVKKADVE